MEHDREAHFLHYLFNIFINQLLLDLNDCYVVVSIGDVFYNYMAYADDITIFSTNAKYLQCILLVCVQGIVTDGYLNMTSINRNV